MSAYIRTSPHLNCQAQYQSQSSAHRTANGVGQPMATVAEACSHTPMVSQKRLVRSAQQLLDNIDSQQEGVVDARSPGRFEGSAPEPRPGLPSGHIPGSRNVPFSEVLSTDGRCGTSGMLGINRHHSDVMSTTTVDCAAALTFDDGKWARAGHLPSSPPTVST